MRKILLPPMIVELITSGITGIDNRVFFRTGICPSCGSKIKGHDIKKKKFATIIEGEITKNIHVFVKRYRCTGCGKLLYADSPFYPGTRLGAPIVDFCIANKKRHPYNHISKILRAMNIVVDRGTVKNYADKSFGPVPCMELYEIKIPVSLISLSEVSFRNESAPVAGAE